jgi:hypothetical protein
MMLLPTRTLQELIGKHGRSLIDDPGQCEELLREACPHHPRQIKVLVEPLQLGMVNELLMAEPGQPWGLLAGPMVRRLTQTGRLSDSEARAALEAWVQALEIAVTGAPFAPLQSLAEVEERQRLFEENSRVRGRRSGRRGGALAGLLIAMAYAIVWTMVRTPRNQPPPKGWDMLDTTLVLICLSGPLAGAMIGTLIGGWLGRTQTAFARMAAGGLVGAVYGACFHWFFAPVFAGRMHASFLIPLQLFVGTFVGLLAGVLLGLFYADHRPQVSDDSKERIDYSDE